MDKYELIKESYMFEQAKIMVHTHFSRYTVDPEIPDLESAYIPGQYVLINTCQLCQKGQ